jgi:hypothetical protein
VQNSQNATITLQSLAARTRGSDNARGRAVGSGV